MNATEKAILKIVILLISKIEEILNDLVKESEKIKTLRQLFMESEGKELCDWVPDHLITATTQTINHKCEDCCLIFRSILTLARINIDG